MTKNNFLQNTDTYPCAANNTKHKKHTFTKAQKKADGSYGVNNNNKSHVWSESDPEFYGYQDFQATYHKNKVSNVPLQIISPVTHLTWL